MHTLFDIGNGVGTFGGGTWNDANSSNMLQNTTTTEWNDLSPHCPVSTYDDHYGTSKVNIISNQLVFKPNFVNIPFTGNIVSNGYTNLNSTTEINQPIIEPIFSEKSALERFVLDSPVPASNNTISAEKKRPKRTRTLFSTEQLICLEREYAKSPYLKSTRRIELAKYLRLNESSIKIWFQNRRKKAKKHQAERMQVSENAISPMLSLDVSNIHIDFGPIHEHLHSQKQVPDDWLTNSSVDIPVEEVVGINSSPIYEPISPARISENNEEDKFAYWTPPDPRESLDILFDLQNMPLL